MYLNVEASDCFDPSLLSFYEKVLKEKGLKVNNQNLWYIHGYLYAKNTLNLYYYACKSMGNMFACFFAGRKLSYSVNVLNERKIEQSIFAEYSSIIANEEDLMQQVCEIKKYIVYLFDERLFEFEQLSERLSLRLSANDLSILKSVAGESYSDKMRYLLRYWRLNEYDV